MRLIYIIFCLLLMACKQESAAPEKASPEHTLSSIEYATGFRVNETEGITMVEVKNAWPGSDKVFKYALLQAGQNLPKGIAVDAQIKVPIASIVVTSTTHIPSLEMLDAAEKLMGFPNLDYISSSLTRSLIEEGRIIELGQNESLNTEVVLSLQPDALVTFGVEGENKNLALLKQAGIAVLYNGDWTEQDPLGKAEWIKFFGLLLGKEKQADSIFKSIANNYHQTVALAEQATRQPTVLSGAPYKDVWYVPQGNSWAAKLIKDAQGDYLWRDTSGTGSLSLSVEHVLEKAQNAEFWIGPGQYTSYSSMNQSSDVFNLFQAVHQRKVYTFAAKKGATRGLIYYELAPNRPDWVLQDLVHILHPKLLPDHEMHFFTPLNE
ncbi:ABC transporter substrate-binding protein [Croceiramulus getboli]|nr:ABC transporter substrate-binding protein [Flavobacteriaceae bacterium YJPT1-3]